LCHSVFKIFIRFFFKIGNNANKTGSGLGLFISKVIVEAHGGKVWAEAYVFIIVVGLCGGYYFIQLF
jgi:signal transduction histidine kinase